MEESSLHGFANGSERAFCGVMYLVHKASVVRYVQMLTSKKRVVPLKKL